MSIKKILVTGGAGFIGSAVIRFIIKNTDYEVINVDKLTYAGNLDNLVEVSSSSRYCFEKLDICDSQKLKEIFKKYQPDAVMHLAAESHVDRSIDRPSDFITTNILGTYSILEIARDYWEHLDKSSKKSFVFHHISTDEVYGDLPHPDNCHDARNYLFKESTPYDPSSPYSASKSSSDHLVRAWMRTYGLPAIVTNCSNNYGPYHFPEKLIPLTILNALDNKPITVYGNGNQIRDWLYVEDHARALLQVLINGATGETYNIGGHNEKKNIDVVLQICEILQQIEPRNTQYKNLITFVEDRPGHDQRYAIDSSKIKQQLGWEPMESFESGIKKTVNWYIKNREWCKRIKDGSPQKNNNGANL